MQHVNRQIITQVERLATQFGTRCPFEWCEHLKITLLMVDLPRTIQGFFVTILKEPFIYLNQSLTPPERRTILAHELGHAVLHPTHNSLFLRHATYLVESRFERQADLFAAQLLLEDHLFDGTIEGVDTLEKISAYTQVPLSYVQMKWDLMV